MTLKIFPQDLILSAMRTRAFSVSAIREMELQEMFKLIEQAGKNRKTSETIRYTTLVHLKTSHCIIDH